MRSVHPVIDVPDPRYSQYYSGARRLGSVAARVHSCFHRARICGLVLLLGGLFPLLDRSVVRADEPVSFSQKILPILVENCFACHGPDAEERQAGLRFDIQEEALDSGTIIQGSPDDSEFMRRVLSSDPDEMMPPPQAHKELSEEQKELLRRWILEGAEYEVHWAFVPPTRPTPPPVEDESWVRNPIDRFILSRLEAAGLQPAPEADRRTLARRLSLDLTGLPPRPEDVEAFVADSDPNYYEKYVDKLLKSQQWGEHRGRYWLDLARYGDTHGIHFDNFREMWAYRDWVIEAFNRNLPFDQFTIEQLAGDLLPEPNLDQKIATGFNRCNITTNEGGVIAEEYLVLYTRDRTETTAQVWLGLTAGCAVCHDHKYDPLSQREFYEMGAFFNNTTQGAMDGNIKDTPPTVVVPQKDDRERWEVVSSELAATRQSIEQRKEDGKGDFQQWLEQADPSESLPLSLDEGLKFHLPLDEQEGEKVRAELRLDGDNASAENAASESSKNGDGDSTVDAEQATEEEATGEEVSELASLEIELEAPVERAEGHVASKAWKHAAEASLTIPEAGDFERDQTFSVAAWVRLPASDATGSILARMADQQGYRGWDLWLEGGRFGTHLINVWQDDALKVVTRDPLPGDQWNHVLMTYDGSSKAAGVKLYVNGQLQNNNVAADTLNSSIRTDVPLKIGQRDSGSKVVDLLIQDVRFYDRILEDADAKLLARGTRAAWLASKPADERSEAEQTELYDWWLPAKDDHYRQLMEQRTALEQEQEAIRNRGTVAHVMNEAETEPTAFVLFRGEYDQRRDQVQASTPAVLPEMPEDLPRNRLGFAQWLLLPENPLTARVTVNRFWQELFGTGIVRSSGDFGLTGELPSHPELLDWLAVNFREEGWDVKRLFRLLVTSSTYRQAAETTPEKLEKDLENRLLSRGPRFRLDAEMIRDYALAASGLLSKRIGGPSVRPYQPEGVWEAVAMIGSNTRNYQRDDGENLYRRSMYTFWKRSAPPASMDIFDAPSREFCTVQRERTNTPLQALATLNDPQLIESARKLAERTLRESGEDWESRIEFLATRVLARPLTDEESTLAESSLRDLLGYYADHPEDAGQLLSVGESPVDSNLAAEEVAAWTMLTNQFLNLDEALNK
jgi:hypothetical protein